MAEEDQKAFKKPHPGGRPPILTQELQDKICNLIKIGSYIETAATACGVSKAVLYQWLKKGNQRGSHKKFRQFLDALNAAVAFSELRDLKAIDDAAHVQKNWKAAAWRLERRAPKRWGRKEQVALYDDEKGEGFQDESSHEQLLDLIEEKDKGDENADG
jgi:transposase